MQDEHISAPRQAHQLLEQLGLELAFAEPGAAGAANAAALAAIVDQLDAACSGTAPNPLRLALAICRHWLNDGMVGGALMADTIANLNQWQPWMNDAVTAWERQRPLPAVPEIWSAVATLPPAVAPPAPRPIAVVPVAVKAGESYSVLPDGIDEDLGQMFCAEAQDLLQDIEQGVLVLEKNPSDKTELDTVFRAFHTFKGNASIIKLAVLQRLTHELESLLDLARREKLHLGRAAIDVILAGADIIRRYIAEMAAQLAGNERGRRIPLAINGVVERVHGLLRGEEAPPAQQLPAAPSIPAPVPVAVSAPVAVAAAAQPIVAPSPPVESGMAAAVVQPAAGAATRPADEQPAPSITQASSQASAQGSVPGAGLVRVDTLKLDGLIDMVGELVVAQSMVVQSPELKGLTDAHLSRCLGQLRSITADLQRTALSLRMVPIRGSFRKMSRLVRDLSVDLGKEINLILEGEDTELDRTVVEELGDPLVHMVRNSADHGIESPAERAAAGKPPIGTITLRAFHQGGFIVIQIEDDGRGLNPEKLLAKAVERGLVQPNENLTRAEIYDLIFRPGFSTAEQVTGVSGRGVGMDVVRRNIEKIRGQVEVDSVAGKGSTFTMYVPLTLAIIEGLLVGVGDQRYIIPTLSVRESFRPLPGTVTTVQERGELVSVRGRLTPLLRLGRHLNTPSKTDDPTEGIVVVIESGQDCRCLFVDELVGKQEVVIKSLGDMFSDQTAFAGAAVLGDGRVGLILDVNALVKLKPSVGEVAV